ncbi:MAG: rhodanese-like domain-containing protein [Actinomycetaceae bacterium]|nr:rhodanese-like domain-containing protein [Actinomycetaceae bacterium]
MKKFVPLIAVVALSLSACHGSVLDEDQSSGAQSAPTTGAVESSQAELPTTLNDAVNSDVLLIDVRTEEEFAAGHVPGAINIPLDQIAEKISEVSADQTQPLALYCRSGNRSGQALSVLESVGYQKLVNLGGIGSYSGTLETGK